MTIEQAIRERLLDIPALTALVGTRVYQLLLPQNGTLPAVRVQLIDDQIRQHLRGPDGNFISRVQIDSYAAPNSSASWYSTAKTVARVIHGDGLGENASGLFGWKGWAGGSPPELKINNVTVAHSGQPYFEHGERPMVRVRYDYMVHWFGALV